MGTEEYRDFLRRQNMENTLGEYAHARASRYNSREQPSNCQPPKLKKLFLRIDSASVTSSSILTPATRQQAPIY